MQLPESYEQLNFEESDNEPEQTSAGDEESEEKKYKPKNPENITEELDLILPDDEQHPRSSADKYYEESGESASKKKPSSSDKLDFSKDLAELEERISDVDLSTDIKDTESSDIKITSEELRRIPEDLIPYESAEVSTELPPPPTKEEILSADETLYSELAFFNEGSAETALDLDKLVKAMKAGEAQDTESESEQTLDADERAVIKDKLLSSLLNPEVETIAIVGDETQGVNAEENPLTDEGWQAYAQMWLSQQNPLIRSSKKDAKHRKRKAPSLKSKASQPNDKPAPIKEQKVVKKTDKPAVKPDSKRSQAAKNPNSANAVANQKKSASFSPAPLPKTDNKKKTKKPPANAPAPLPDTDKKRGKNQKNRKIFGLPPTPDDDEKNN